MAPIKAVTIVELKFDSQLNFVCEQNGMNSSRRGPTPNLSSRFKRRDQFAIERLGHMTTRRHRT